MAFKEMTTWVTGPDGTRFCLGVDQDDTVRLMMRRPSKGVESDVRVLSFHRKEDPPHMPRLTLARNENLPNSLGLELTAKGQVALHKG